MSGYTISQNKYGYWQVFFGQTMLASSKDLDELKAIYPDAFVNRGEE